MHKFCCIVSPKTTSLLPSNPSPGWTLPGGNALNSDRFKKEKKSQESRIVVAIFLMALTRLRKGVGGGKSEARTG